ncbi:MAG TPA: hypothetical protein VL860_01155 [Planctomycetota bacterium]|nr:hypothetical protein [Planctomycetota bacterium]
MSSKQESPSSLRLASGNSWLAVLALLPVLFGGAFAQQAVEGVDNGNYHYQGSFEFGYRFVNTHGSQAIYDTFVNQRQGLRLLDETLNVRSLNHEGGLFDTLSLSSFGWGGDPENASRLRMSKNKWYDFSGTFRRDHNFFDYNTLANPLNPANAYVQVNDSPHAFATVRRMYDYNLTLAPQSPVRLRLGFTRNNMEGPAFSTVHQGTDALLLQNTRTLLDGYQFGVDFKVLPRTSISYDQFLQYYKGDSSWTDQNLLFQVGGSPVDIGISYNPLANQPCAAPVLDATTTPPTMNPACNGFQSYNRWAPVRVSYPTEQLSLQSRYIPKVDVTARASYSASGSNVSNWYEEFVGLATRTRERAGVVSGPSSSRRIAANADLGVTVHVTDKFRLVDGFRFSNFRIPGTWNLLSGNLFGATLLSTPNLFDLATCPPPFTAATCPQHSTSSGADITQDQRYDFLRQNSKLNTFALEYDFTRRITGHLGYRYEIRELNNNFYDFQNLTYYPSLANRGPCATVTLVDGVCYTTATSDGAETIAVHAHSLLAGVVARPTDNLRTTFDLELFSADNAPTRISPRNLQHYKGRASYKPMSWFDVSGTVNVLESRDNVPEILHREHNRNYGFATSLTPRPRFGFEFGYNYDDVFSTTNICYILASTPPVNSTACGAGSPYFSAISLYTNKVHFGYTNFMFKPRPRVTLNLGYNLTNMSGFSPTLSDPTIVTSLGFNYHKPSAAMDVNLARGLTWRTAWGYYDYNEKFLPAPLLARDFQSNLATLSMRYEF